MLKDSPSDKRDEPLSPIVQAYIDGYMAGYPPAQPLDVYEKATGYMRALALSHVAPRTLGDTVPEHDPVGFAGTVLKNDDPDVSPVWKAVCRALIAAQPSSEREPEGVKDEPYSFIGEIGRKPPTTWTQHEIQRLYFIAKGLEERLASLSSIAPRIENPSRLVGRLREACFPLNDQRLIRESALCIEHLARELDAARHDLERATVNHSADLSAPSATAAPEKDAARYRYLRDNPSNETGLFVAIRTAGGISQVTKAYADNLIDRAMSAATDGGGASPTMSQFASKEDYTKAGGKP